MGIPLCRGNACVAEHFLHDPDVRPAADERGRERVAERVGRKAALRSIRIGIMCKYELDAAHGQGISALRDEQYLPRLRMFLMPAEAGFPLCQIAVKGFAGGFREKNLSLLVSLSLDYGGHERRIDVGKPEGGYFGNAAARGIEERKEGGVARGPQRIARRAGCGAARGRRRWCRRTGNAGRGCTRNDRSRRGSAKGSRVGGEQKTGKFFRHLQVAHRNPKWTAYR